MTSVAKGKLSPFVCYSVNVFSTYTGLDGQYEVVTAQKTNQCNSNLEGILKKNLWKESWLYSQE